LGIPCLFVAVHLIYLVNQHLWLSSLLAAQFANIFSFFKLCINGVQFAIIKLKYGKGSSLTKNINFENHSLGFAQKLAFFQFIFKR